MARYDHDDDGGGTGGFEDPRFANGRRPDDDDDDGFGRAYGVGGLTGGGAAGAGRGAGRRVGCGCWLTLLGLGAGLAVLCCGGGAWLLETGRHDRIAATILDDPALRGQLEERLGPGVSLSPNLSETWGTPGEREAFDAVGPRGAGVLFVETRPARDDDPDAAPGAVRALSGRLRLDDGTSVRLWFDGEPPMNRRPPLNGEPPIDGAGERGGEAEDRPAADVSDPNAADPEAPGAFDGGKPRLEVRRPPG